MRGNVRQVKKGVLGEGQVKVEYREKLEEEGGNLGGFCVERQDGERGNIVVGKEEEI